VLPVLTLLHLLPLLALLLLPPLPLPLLLPPPPLPPLVLPPLLQLQLPLLSFLHACSPPMMSQVTLEGRLHHRLVAWS
jgi:hypothetical protein